MSFVLQPADLSVGQIPGRSRQGGLNGYSPCQSIDPANNIAKPGLKWGLRLARACLAPGFAGDVGVEIALVIDVAVDGEPQP